MKLVQTQVRFSIDTQYGNYTDALYYEPSVYSTLQQSDIDAAIQSRVDAWVYNIQNPPPPPVYVPQYTITNEDGSVSNV